MKNIENKNDLIGCLERIDKNLPIRLYCSFNNYEIKRIILFDDFIALEAGEIDNPESFK